jgi:hypothetical protein
MPDNFVSLLLTNKTIRGDAQESGAQERVL